MTAGGSLAPPAGEPNISGMNSVTMVAMSGGVDSSVTALLLKQQGAEIAGLFMKNWEDDDVGGPCPAEDDARDARCVAEMLNIPFHARNFAHEYWEQVFEQFLAELSAGRTPNPDILCNREIKFKTFVEHAADLGAESIATGHYARRGRGADGRFQLLKGKDGDKDQSYFLYAISQDQLAAAYFPVGELDKAQVRRLAGDAGLPVSDKKDSTGICFIGERNFNAFIDRYLDAEPGEIRTPAGRVIGEHRGLIHYTFGQRKGLGIGGVQGFPEAPWFVARKDVEDNALVVVQGENHPLLLGDRLEARDLNWIGGEPPSDEGGLTAKIRYRQADQACRIVSLDGDVMNLSFERPQRAITPGQSVVLYDGDTCLGGGVIQ